MSKQEKVLQDLAKELHKLAGDDVKWTSPRARDKADVLEVIWDTISEMRIGRANPLHTKAEKLRLEVLRQISTLDEKRFSLLVAELREGATSRRAKISLASIRLRSLPDRMFEKIHPWIDQTETGRAKRAKSD